MAKLTQARGVAMTAPTKIVEDKTQLYEVGLKRAARQYVDEYCKIQRRLSKGTVRQHRGAMDLLITVCGDGFPVHTLTATHFTWAMDKAGKGDTPGEKIARVAGLGNHSRARTGRTGLSLNINLSVYRSFIKWAQGERYFSPYLDPLRNFQRAKAVKRTWGDKWTVPFAERDLLLQFAGNNHPRDRAVAAFGLWGGRRTSDIKFMKISDINLDEETFTFNNVKSSRNGIVLPILWPEFMAEIRRWLAWYAGQHGDLDPNWFLFPQRLASTEYFLTEGQPQLHPGWPVDPTKPAYNVGEDMRKALEMLKAPASDHLGMHTLRHSCAVWLLDHEKWDFYDVSLWLDHSSPTVTRQTYTLGSQQVQRLRDAYQNPNREKPDNVFSMFDARRKKLEEMASDETA